MKKIVIVTCISILLLASCGKDEPVVVSGPKGKAPANTAKAAIVDSGPANQGSNGLGGGGGGGGSSSSAKKSDKKTVDYTVHNTSTDCYTRISDKIYDLTNIIPQFGDLNDQLVSMCGEDATAFYNNKLVSNTELVTAIEGSEVK